MLKKTINEMLQLDIRTERRQNLVFSSFQMTLSNVTKIDCLYAVSKKKREKKEVTNIGDDTIRDKSSRFTPLSIAFTCLSCGFMVALRIKKPTDKINTFLSIFFFVDLFAHSLSLDMIFDK